MNGSNVVEQVVLVAITAVKLSKLVLGVARLFYLCVRHNKRLCARDCRSTQLHLIDTADPDPAVRYRTQVNQLSECEQRQRPSRHSPTNGVRYG